MNEHTHKHPDYPRFIKWAEELNIEEWRVDSMIERIGGDTEKLRRQKKLPWLYKKGRRKYRIYIARWMKLWKLHEEAEYVLNWKPEEEQKDECIETDPVIYGHKIVFLEDDPLRPPDAPYERMESQDLKVYISEEDSLKTPRALAARFLLMLIHEFFVLARRPRRFKDMPFLGGRFTWNNETWQSMLWWVEKLETDVDFPEYNENNISSDTSGDYVIITKKWSQLEWNKVKTTAKRYFPHDIVAVKKQILWPDYHEVGPDKYSYLYPKCPWTKRHLKKWMNEDLRRGRPRDRVISDYRPGFHILKWWRVKYCNPHALSNFFGGLWNNEIANMISSCMEEFVGGECLTPHDVWKDFRQRLNTKLNEVRQLGIHLGFLGVSNLTVFGVWTLDKMEKEKAQLQYYLVERESRDPRSLCFNPAYRKYLRKRARAYIKRGKKYPEYTEYGDIRLVTNIDPEDDGLADSKSANPELDLESFYKTSDLINKINSLWKKLQKKDPKYRPLLSNW